MNETAIIEQRIALLYRLDPEGRLLSANEPCGPMGPAPMAHVIIGRSVVAYALRGGLPDALTDRLAGVLLDKCTFV
jgi:hypothetical protein